MYDFNSTDEIRLTVALIGQTKWGKSSIRELHSGKNMDYAPNPSVEINMFDRLEFYEEFSVRLSIWDIPGRRILRPIAQQYIKTADAVIIMYDATNPKAYDQTEDLIKNVIKIKQQDDYWCMLIFSLVFLVINQLSLICLQSNFNVEIIYF